jgi:hypothetical protein
MPVILSRTQTTAAQRRAPAGASDRPARMAAVPRQAQRHHGVHLPAARRSGGWRRGDDGRKPSCKKRPAHRRCGSAVAAARTPRLVVAHAGGASAGEVLLDLRPMRIRRRDSEVDHDRRVAKRSERTGRLGAAKMPTWHGQTSATGARQGRARQLKGREGSRVPTANERVHRRGGRRCRGSATGGATGGNGERSASRHHMSQQRSPRCAGGRRDSPRRSTAYQPNERSCSTRRCQATCTAACCRASRGARRSRGDRCPPHALPI